MAEPASTLDAVSLPPTEAIAFLRAKTNTTSQRWTDVWNEAHTRAFAVAGAASDAIVADFRAAVAKALEQGTTLAEFRKEFDAIVDKHGWVHNGTPGWRASIIYETNLSTSYSAGRYAQMTEPDTLRVYPYWQYMHTSSAHPRPQHLAWVGTTLRADDPWWDTHYPPNGWRCKCGVRPVSEAGLRRMGKRGPDTAPPLDMRPWRSADGQITTEVPHGIDPSFAYNPGKAWQEGLTPPIAPEAAPPALAARPHLPPAEAVEPPAVSDHDLAAFLRAPRGTVTIGSMPLDVASAMGGEGRSVQLSEQTLEKQLAHHPEIGRAEYGAARGIVVMPDVVLREGERRLVLLGRAGPGDPIAVFVKSTESGSERFIVSLRRARPKDVRRLLRRHELLFGSVSALAADEVDTEDEADGAPEGPPSNPSSRSRQ